MQPGVFHNFTKASLGHFGINKTYKELEVFEEIKTKSMKAKPNEETEAGRVSISNEKHASHIIEIFAKHEDEKITKSPTADIAC